MQFRRSSHSVFQCQYHVVWTTKYRKRALKESVEQEYCESILRRAAQEFGMLILSCEVDLDHVHVYMEIPPQRSVGSAVRVLKSVSARGMFRRFPYMKNKFWSGELWGEGYFCRTVGEGVTAGIVRRYLENHADKGLEPAQGELFPKERVRPKRR